jgi:Protein of unknown function (DUF1573)
MRDKTTMFIVLGFVCIGAGITKLLTASMSNFKRSPLQVMPAKVDLGIVVEGADASGILQIYNPSNQTIIIESAATSCGCTTAYAPHQVLPNGKEDIQIKFHSQDRVGNIKQVVHIKAQGFFEPIDIPVVGKCKKEISLSSRMITMNEKHKGVLIVERISNKPLKISSIEHAKSIIAKVTPLSLTRSQIDFSLQGTSLAGSHEEIVTIHTDDPALPIVKVPILWRTEGTYRLSPVAVNFGLVAKDSSQKTTIAITGSDVSKLKIMTPEVSDSTLETSLVRQNLQKALLIVAWRASNRGSPLLQGTVKLSTGNSAEPIIIIPVYAAIASNSNECNADRPCSSMK